jgi:GntR family transcriptional regulator
MSSDNGLHTPIRVRPNVPVAITVANHLRGRLRRDFVNGGQLPSEHLLAAELGVSRGTLRQGLAILQHEGLITRKQGSGTFARPDVEGIPARIDFAYEFTELIRAAGYEPDVETLEIGPACASEEAVRRLDIKLGAPMLRVRKLFRASGTPAIYVDEVLPTSLIRDEDYDPAELQRPIWHFLSRRCNHPIKYVLSELLPALADEALSRLLALEPGTPLLKFIEVFYDAKNAPMVLAYIYFNAALIRFHALRKVSPVI